MWLQYSDIFEAQGAKFPTTGSVLLGEVPALPGVVQAYVQVGTGRGAPR